MVFRSNSFLGCFLDLNCGFVHPAEHGVEGAEKVDQFVELDLAVAVRIQVNKPLIDEALVDWDAQLLPLEVLPYHAVQFLAVQRVALIDVELVEVVTDGLVESLWVLLLGFELCAYLLKLS